MTSAEPAWTKVKRALRPIYRQRRWIERWRYRGRDIADGQAGHDRVRDAVAGGCAALGKIGESELRGLVCYLRHRDDSGHCGTWTRRTRRLYDNAGVFPAGELGFNQFGREFARSLAEVDTLGVWFKPGEAATVGTLAPSATLVRLNCLEPWRWIHPWFSLVAGKRLLVVSPFARTIRSQHERMEQLWRLRPEMAVPFSLTTLETPLCAALVASPYATWGDGLHALRERMSTLEFDIAIIGAGAWSLPLAVHAKRMGRVGIHLGGPTQLLFGVLGQRWDRLSAYNRYFNEQWVRPGTDERPDNFRDIEGGCYW